MSEGVLSAEEIRRIALSGSDAETSSSTLVHSACESDGQDNITAAVLVCRDH